MIKRTILLCTLFNVFIAAFAASTESTGINNASSAKDGMLKRYSLESIRLSDLAKKAFADGDYDAARQYADNAVKAAELSNNYIKQILVTDEANYKMGIARKRLGWADNAGAAKYFTKEFYDAKEYYNRALYAQTENKWNDTIANADKVVAVLAAVVAPPSMSALTNIIATDPALKNNDTNSKNTPLPAQYIVRPWDTFGDCFWNIAGKSWVYGDPHRWPILYQANKQKLSDPKNPNLIDIGMIMDIPSVRGEIRSGLWDSGTAYKPLR